MTPRFQWFGPHCRDGSGYFFGPTHSTRDEAMRWFKSQDEYGQFDLREVYWVGLTPTPYKNPWYVRLFKGDAP